MREENLIFIFSLPRCGSTLLQRMLCRSIKVKSISEPSLLLPLMYHRHDKDIYASYNVQVFSKGVNDLVSLYKNGWEEYDDELRSFVLSLYARALGERGEYFVDKTPRYSLIAPEIVKLFPHAKFIFLWRDPLRVIDSMIGSLWSGRWLPSRMAIDIEQGVSQLCSAAELLGEQAVHIQYEQLVRSPEVYFNQLVRTLELGYLFKVEELEKELPARTGTLGDPANTGQSKAVFSTSAARPLQHLNSIVRQKWILKRLKAFPDVYWQKLGKSYKESESELSACSIGARSTLQDLAYSVYSGLDDLFDLSIRKERFKTKARYVCR